MMPGMEKVLPAVSGVRTKPGLTIWMVTPLRSAENFAPTARLMIAALLGA